MVGVEKLKNHKRSSIIGVLIPTILVNGGFFPIINSNPENPVDLGVIMHLLIIVMPFAFHKTIGSLEAIILSDWSATFTGILNAVMVLCGLICRYLLEFGEISNTYNFTFINISFQTISLTMVSTVVYVLKQKENKFLHIKQH